MVECEVENIKSKVDEKGHEIVGKHDRVSIVSPTFFMLFVHLRTVQPIKE